MGKTVVQCDFDGTITYKDVSFKILDAFTDGEWRDLWGQYQRKEIAVGTFNTRAFAMVKSDEKTLTEFVLRVADIRPGFNDLLDVCRRKGFEFVIVSNGLDFYIQAILSHLGLDGIKVFAAQNRFGVDGLEVRYIGPDGQRLEVGFKDAYVKMYQEQGYRVIYLGNGASDLPPAKMSERAFATGDLLTACEDACVECTPFEELSEVAAEIELM